jgi:hypothetical protein
MKLARVGDPFVDQDQARAVFDEQLAQHVAGAGRLLVVGLDTCKRLFAAKLPRKLTPKGSHHSAVSRLVEGLPGEILLPTRTTRLVVGSFFTPASCITTSMPTSSVGAISLPRDSRIAFAAVSAAAPRLYRNTLVFLAADKTRLQDLDEAVRKFLAWESILAEKTTLNLDPP